MRWTMLAAAVALGAVLGFLGARVVFVNSGLSLLPWGLAGLAVGVVEHRSRRAAALAGAAYGFVLAYDFMLASYDGSAALATRLVPFLAFGVVGGVCGALLATVGAVARNRQSGGSSGS